MGVSIASMITIITQLIIVCIYASFVKEIKEAWFLPNKDTFKDIGA
jgi:hypothetical protein